MLSVLDLTKRFTLHTQGGKVIEAPSAFSFSLHEGMFLGLAGPSGSGKSTVLKCIYRTYPPTKGVLHYHSLLFGPVDLAQLDEHRMLDLRRTEIAYVSQFLRVIPRVPAIEIVASALKYRSSASDREALHKAAELLERLGIPPRLFDTYPSTFSGGEQQRVNIARSVIWRPRLLLLDEPTASLDSTAAATVVDILRELRDAGSTMIGIFHDRATMAQLADQVHEFPQQRSVHAYRD